VLAVKRELAKLEELFQLSQPENVVEHRVVRLALSGCRLTPATKRTLLTSEKDLANPNNLFQLLQLQDIAVMVQLPIHARGGGICRGVMESSQRVVRSGLFELLQEENATNAGELAERNIATLSFKVQLPGFEKLAPGCVEGGIKIGCAV